jgi:hypothetical protein
MNKVLVYTQTLDPQTIISALGDQEVTSVNSFLRLAERVVEEKNLLCVLIQIDGLDEECQKFLTSLKKNFPILGVGVITKDTSADLPQGYSRIDVRLQGDAFNQEVQNFISSLVMTNKREHNRFDWPLRGFLSLDGKTWTEYPLRSISAGGAFLECGSSLPVPGSRGVLRVVFQNFKMLTRCEVLDARQASSNLPPGFGVRFTELSDASKMIIDQIVQNALVSSLVEPEREVVTPTLGGEDQLTPDFELD